MKRGSIIFLLTALGLLSLACGPSATPTPAPEPTAGATIEVSNPDPGPAEPVVIPVDQQIEQEGITVGVTEVTLTGQEITVGYWRDCGPHHLEPMLPHVLVVAGEPVEPGTGSGGFGGNPCDPSHIRQLTFPPLPAGVDQFSFRHGNILGTSPEEIALELPLGDRLSALDPAIGGELELDLLAGSGELAYRFTRLSMGIDQFTLDLQPANKATDFRPLGDPLGELFIEDDLGNQYRGRRNSSGFKVIDAKTLVWEDGRLEFRGHIDTEASTWQLRVPNLGKIYRGPWQFDIEIPTDVQVPTPAPTATPTPTLTPAPRVAVTPTATSGPEDPTRLMQALSMVPLEFSDKQVVFSDFATSRTVTGLEHLRSSEDFGNLGPDLYRLYEGVPGMPPQLRYAGSLKEHTGLDLFSTDLMVWGGRTGQRVHSTFLLLQGRYPSDTIAEKLLALDYQPAKHQETAYYWLSEDNALDIDHPLRTMTLPLNRVALVDNWFLASPTTGNMERLIDMQVGEAPTLLDSPAHRVLAEAVGRGLVGGAFVTPGWVLENWNPFYGVGPLERLDRYMSGPDQWGRLSPYAVGLMGYRVQSEAEELVIALYYPDPQSAKRDSAELEKRWRTFHESLTTSGPVEEPIARYCSPMTTQIIEEEDYSVLVGACPVMREEEPGPQTVGPRVWTRLLDAGELPFLALDLEELRVAAEQRASE